MIRGAKYLAIWIFAHIILSVSQYERRYIQGKWFTNKYCGVGAEGWQWICDDFRGCRLLRVNKNVPWPVSPRSTVIFPENIEFHPDTLDNFQSFGNYYQAAGKITIGKGTYIAPNVGIITANHNINDPDEHVEPRPVTLGKKCWIGMNSVVLPGVTLGDSTIVGAGSIVTKSFPDGHCVIAGNPAKLIKTLEENDLEHQEG